MEITITLCPGTFDSFFGGFLSPLLESPAPKVPSTTLQPRQLLLPSSRTAPCCPDSCFLGSKIYN
ncbi:hypothetical protein K469DRAFT_709839 [Zopfia rhizophila CBS 207.26]|uniref:Uncharacterized protein n=1 Tax=Zopfia rhizophila CBS 207.26 TaxID=1314779 RepID=A0A6A6ERX8_9PEZI|nr:hypothetical protein K469DRAFT_709839 [Zopfia rhizophila CBS 207.26]